jgi:hypothetical protein
VRFFSILLALVASPAAAQIEEDSGPWKLVLVINEKATAVIDYKNSRDCQIARSIAERHAEEDNAARVMADDELLKDGAIARPYLRIIAFCIPA